MSTSNLSASSTHDLWVEARKFTLEISRPTPTTIQLDVSYPAVLDSVDGLVITLNEKPISGSNYPSDGAQYNPSLDFAVPIDRITGLNGAHVVAFYSSILNNPIPTGIVNASTGMTSFSITITNTVANTIYYASVHPATNVLQYYPIGVQSYALEGSRIEKDSSTFTGNIPSLPEAPVSPTLGMVYFDQQLNQAQYWTGSIWIPTKSDAILTGPINPGIAGHTYLLNSTVLKVFDGIKWVSASPSNLQFRVGAGFSPLGSVNSVTILPETGMNVGDFYWNFTTLRYQYWDGGAWQFPNPNSALFNTGSTLIPAFTSQFSTEWIEFLAPTLGQLFYNSTSKALNAWNGTSWQQVNTDQQGTPTTDKIAIGSDGSYDERVRVIKILKSQLGWPAVCVELAEEQFNIGIDNALDNYRAWVGSAYRQQFVMFSLIPNQQMYYLNSATDKTDRIVDVTKVHRLNALGVANPSGQDAIWTSGILTSYYSAANVDMLSLHLLSSLSEDFERLFAGNLTFLWDEASRELLITRKINRFEKVILECQMEKTEQEILVDRWAKQFIQNWALAECKMQLGMIRSKFTSGTPGAAGPINLNGEMLITEARQDMAELKQSCLDFEFGGLVNSGNCSFLLG